MVDIPQIVLDAIKDSDMLEEKLSDILTQGEHDIQTNIREGPHTGLTSYKEGTLFGSVNGDVVSNDGLNAVLRFYTDTPYDSFQNEGTRYITGRHFMEYGVEDLVNKYG